MRRAWFGLAVVLGAMVAVSGAASAAEPLEKLVGKVMQEVWPAGKAPAASGVFVDPSGLVLTNAHAVAGCRGILAGPRGMAAPATLLAMDTMSDMALIRTSKRAAVALAPARDAAPTAGRVRLFALDFAGPVAKPAQMSADAAGLEPAGHISLMKLRRLDRPVPDGWSGGPVLDARGRLIGMVVGRLNTQEAVAVRGARIARFLDFYGVRAGRATATAQQVQGAVAEVRCQ